MSTALHWSVCTRNEQKNLRPYSLCIFVFVVECIAVCTAHFREPHGQLNEIGSRIGDCHGADGEKVSFYTITLLSVAPHAVFRSGICVICTGAAAAIGETYGKPKLNIKLIKISLKPANARAAADCDYDDWCRGHRWRAMDGEFRDENERHTHEWEKKAGTSASKMNKN